MKTERRLPIWCICVYIFTGIVAICHVLFCFLPDFADRFNMTVGAFSRGVFSLLSGIFPFSLAELIIVTLPVGVTCLCIWAVWRIVRSPGVKSTRMVFSLLSVLCLLYCAFSVNFASAYRGRPLDEKLGIEAKEVSAAQLKRAAEYFRDSAEAEVDKLSHSFASGVPMPYSLTEMTEKLNDAYAVVSEKYDFVQSLRAPVKSIALSEPMTYTHISGVYTFFTGEANININFPDYSLPYTAAHEMSHQRGIAPEDEANFMAFLVCRESEDAFVRYSGYMSMYEYLLNALYTADKGMYSQVMKATDDRLIREIMGYNEFFSQYKDGTVATVSDAVNDTYLKLQGQSKGTESYGTVVDLAVAWCEREAYNIV